MAADQALETRREAMLKEDAHQQISVATLHVVIRTLVVGKKQFTVAMLKQLPAKDIYSFQMKEPQGTLWGVVRYPLARSGYTAGHHLIFELDGKLYRHSSISEVTCLENAPRRKTFEDLVKCAEQLFIAV